MKTNGDRKTKRRHGRCALLALSESWCDIATIALLSIVSVSVRAQNFSIDWHTIDGGGGTSTGGVCSINGTIGQPDAGALSGGNYSLAGGFWGIIGVVQIPNGPLLTIRRTQTNTVVVSWPSPSRGFSLQQATDLTTPAWNAPTETVSDNGTNEFIIVNPPTGNRVYRTLQTVTACRVVTDSVRPGD